ncbi:MAG: hypothetical protein AABX39_03175, partial [Nanoarchaeota archaeon]
LTIDTQKDSHEEIKKAIRMLTALVGEVGSYSNEGSVRSRNIFDDPSSVLGSSDSSSNLNSQPEQSSTPEQSGGIFGFFDNANSYSGANNGELAELKNRASNNEISNTARFFNNADKQVQVPEEKKAVSTREDRVTEYY